jgi:hypothetical protein
MEFVRHPKLFLNLDLVVTFVFTCALKCGWGDFLFQRRGNELSLDEIIDSGCGPNSNEGDGSKGTSAGEDGKEVEFGQLYPCQVLKWLHLNFDTPRESFRSLSSFIVEFGNATLAKRLPCYPRDGNYPVHSHLFPKAGYAAPYKVDPSRCSISDDSC